MDSHSSSVSNTVIERTKSYISSLQNEAKNHKRDLKAIGCISEAVSSIGIHPILVGGQAVELYSFGNYASVDFDFVVIGREQFGLFLEEVGFEKFPGQRHWVHDGLELAIEVPDSTLAGSLEKVTRVDVDGFVIHVIGIEDLILDRLRAAVYWNSSSDHEWARFLIQSYMDDIDIGYMKDVASREDSGLYETLVPLFVP